MIFDGEREYIGPYLRFLANEVGLRDWTIQYLDDPPDDESHMASSDVVYGRKYVCVRFDDNWSHQAEESFRSTCVHELLHSHFQNIWEPLNSIKEYIGHQLYAPAHNGMRLHIEHAIDAIADEWSRHLPLPSEWLEMETNPEEAA